MSTPLDAIPLDAVGRHVPSDSCGCQPIQGTDLLEPGRVVRIHRHATWPRDVPPPDADALLWRSRERRGEPFGGGGRVSDGRRTLAQGPQCSRARCRPREETRNMRTRP